MNRQKWFEKRWAALSGAQRSAFRLVLDGKGSTVDAKLLAVLNNRLLIERRVVGSKAYWYVPDHVEKVCGQNLSDEN